MTARRRIKKKPAPIRDWLVKRNGRYLTGSLTGSQFTDDFQFAARTTRETAEGYLGRADGKYEIEQYAPDSGDDYWAD